jgi:hypothetical protein
MPASWPPPFPTQTRQVQYPVVADAVQGTCNGRVGKAIAYRHEHQRIAIALNALLQCHYRDRRIRYALRIAINDGANIHAALHQAPAKTNTYLTATVDNDWLVHRGRFIH